jgi:hypothetical protein
MRMGSDFDIHQPVSIQLVGGLGNQLFGYFAGEYLRASFGLNVNFIPSIQSHGVFGLPSSLLDLGIHPLHLATQPQIRSATVKRKMYSLGVRLGVGESLLSSKLSVFRSEEVGFDSKVSRVNPGTLVEGYFQSYKYTDYVSDKTGPLVISIKTPTPWLSSQLIKVSEERPIMVHVRRGDYRNLSATYGNLDSRYYIEGIEILREKLGSRPVWAFSDEIDDVKSELGNKLPKSTVYVAQPRDSSAAEALYLMSLGSGSVISNSTFSWWSAKLRHGGPTVAPQSWFKALQEPLDLIPPDWTRIPSTWL